MERILFDPALFDFGGIRLAFLTARQRARQSGFWSPGASPLGRCLVPKGEAVPG